MCKSSVIFQTPGGISTQQCSDEIQLRDHWAQKEKVNEGPSALDHQLTVGQAMSGMFHIPHSILESFQGGTVVKNLPANAGHMGLIPGWERSPGVGNSKPLQYSCLENPMDRGALQSTMSQRVGHNLATEHDGSNSTPSFMR